MKEFFAGMVFTLVLEGGVERMRKSVKVLMRTVGVIIDIIDIFRKRK